MNSRPKQPKYARNKNILVIGGSGSGKTRFFVKPNLMQMHSSYVVTDPKGTVLVECGKLLQRGGYRIKVLNTINFKKSMKYNPFAYLRSEKDILKLVNTLIANTKGDGEKAGEDFWIKSERLFYCALIGYIWYEAPEEEKNFTTLLEMINASEAREDDPEFQSPVDLMFERLEEKDPEHFAVRQYKKFLLSAGKTRSSTSKNLRTIPVTNTQLIMAKISMLFIFSVAFCLISTLSVALFCKLFHVGMVYGMTYKIFMSLIFGVLIVAASLPIVFLIIYFNKSFLLSILLAFFYSIFNWGILGTIGTSISAAKIAFLNSFPVICVMNWTSGLMMDNLQKDNLLPEAYAIVPTTFHTIFIMAITVVLSLWLIIRFYKKWTR